MPPSPSRQCKKNGPNAEAEPRQTGHPAKIWGQLANGKDNKRKSEIKRITWTLRDFKGSETTACEALLAAEFHQNANVLHSTSERVSVSEKWRGCHGTSIGFSCYCLRKVSWLLEELACTVSFSTSFPLRTWCSCSASSQPPGGSQSLRRSSPSSFCSSVIGGRLSG